jgi:putative hydrolase of HD superfamily
MDTKQLLKLIQKIGALKNTPRAGWRVRGIKSGESVADHCFRVSLLAMVLADEVAESGQELDREKVLRMALLHDIAESEIGDLPLTAALLIGKKAKEEAEDRAMGRLMSDIGKSGQRYREIWREFEVAKSPEARLVRAADKLEMLIQAFEYEAVGYRCLDEFWQNDSNRPFFDEFPVIREMVAQLERERSNPNGSC